MPAHAATELVFWSALGLVAYAYLGYPALLLLLARVNPAPRVRKQPFTPRVSLVIVARNEESRLAEKLGNCLALEYPRELLEILVVSDGSDDRTAAVAAEFADRGVRSLQLAEPRGKAAALNEAIPQTRGEILLLSDARQQLAPDALRQLTAHFADPTVGAVSGELHLSPPIGGGAVAGVGLYWSYEKLIRRAESRLGSTVGVTGAIYALRRSLFRPLDTRTILDDVALPMGVVLAGYRVQFEPAAVAWDRIPEHPGHEYRRKVRTLAGNYQLLALYPELLDPRRNRLLWQFVSHKLSRLAVPWCLLLLLAASGVLAAAGATPGRIALGFQAVLYGLAAAGAAPLRHPPRPIALAYSFVLLNVAAAHGLIGFLRGTETAGWKKGQT